MEGVYEGKVTPLTPQQSKLARNMREIWATFARRGQLPISRIVNNNYSLISRVQLKGPLEVSRSESEIANSQSECFYASYVLSGALTVAQAGQTNTARPGDLALFTSSEPVRLQSYGGFTDLTLRLPKNRLPELTNRGAHSHNLLFTAKRMSQPLSSCLNTMAEGMSCSSAGALKSLFDTEVCRPKSG